MKMPQTNSNLDIFANPEAQFMYDMEGKKNVCLRHAFRFGISNALYLDYS